MVSSNSEESPFESQADRARREQVRTNVGPTIRQYRLFRPGLVLTLLAIGVIEVWCRLGLYGDGAFLFWTDLQTHGTNLVPNFANARMIADILPQLPLIAALHLGVNSVSTLSLIWSAGVVFVPLLLWLLALKILWRNPLFWHFAIVVLAIQGTSSFFVIGEYNFAYALVGLNVALLIDGMKTGPRRLTFLLAAIATVWSYPSMIYLGPALVALVAILIAQDARTHHLAISTTVLRCFGITAYVVATAMARYSIDHPNGSNVEGTSNVLAPFRADVGQLRWTVLFVLVFLFATFFRRFGSLSIGAVCVVAWMVFFEPHNRVLSQYDNRVVAGGFLVLGIGMMTIATLSPNRDHTPRFWLVIAVASFGLYNLVPLVTWSFGYHRWQDNVKSAILEREAPTTFVHGVFSPPSAKDIYLSPYRWSWGYAFLSADLEPNRRQSMVLDRGDVLGPHPVYGFTSDLFPAPFAYTYTE